MSTFIPKIKAATLHRQNSIYSTISSSKSPPKARFIDELYDQFVYASNSVTVDYDETHLNLFAVDQKQNGNKIDPFMALAKLKRLQNNAEINRANMQLEGRQRNPLRRQNNLYKSYFSGEPYLNSYRKLKEKGQSEHSGQHSESEDQPIPQASQLPGITHFKDLKRHPKLLNYTLQRVKSKQLSQRKDIDRHLQAKQNLRQQIRRATINPQMMKAKLSDKINNSTIDFNAQQIIEDKFRKIYAKGKADKLSPEIKSNPRCRQIMLKQQELMVELQSSTVGKVQLKKLKNKFNEIIIELHKSQRRRSEQLPQLAAKQKSKGNY